MLICLRNWISSYLNPLIITTKVGLQPLIIGKSYIKQAKNAGTMYRLLLPIIFAAFNRSLVVLIKSAYLSKTSAKYGGTNG